MTCCVIGRVGAFTVAWCWAVIAGCFNLGSDGREGDVVLVSQGWVKCIVGGFL